MRPRPAGPAGTWTRPFIDQRCPLCGIYVFHPAADLRTDRRHYPGPGDLYVCGYCGYVAQFTGLAGEVTEAQPVTVQVVCSTTNHRTLVEKLRIKHYGKKDGGPATVNGVFERTVYTQPTIDPKEFPDKKE